LPFRRLSWFFGQIRLIFAIIMHPLIRQPFTRLFSSISHLNPILVMLSPWRSPHASSIALVSVEWKADFLIGTLGQYRDMNNQLSVSWILSPLSHFRNCMPFLFCLAASNHLRLPGCAPAWFCIFRASRALQSIWLGTYLVVSVSVIHRIGFEIARPVMPYSRLLILILNCSLAFHYSFCIWMLILNCSLWC
jgi:hypothetical protein